MLLTDDEGVPTDDEGVENLFVETWGGVRLCDVGVCGVDGRRTHRWDRELGVKELGAEGVGFACSVVRATTRLGFRAAQGSVHE